MNGGKSFLPGGGKECLSGESLSSSYGFLRPLSREEHVLEWVRVAESEIHGNVFLLCFGRRSPVGSGRSAWTKSGMLHYDTSHGPRPIDSDYSLV